MAFYIVKVRVCYEGVLGVDEANPMQAETAAKGIIDAATTFNEEMVPANTKSLHSSDAMELAVEMLTLPPCR